MEAVQPTDGESCSTSVVDGMSRKYNTRSSTQKHSIMTVALLSSDGSLKPMEGLGLEDKVGDAVSAGKGVPRNRYPSRSKRLLTIQEPQGAAIKDSGSSKTIKSVTRNKRSRAGPSEVTAVPATSGMAYFGVSDKESVSDITLVQQVDTATPHLHESVVTTRDLTSVTSLFEPEVMSLAVQHLKAVDSILRTVIETHECPKFQKCDNFFVALARSIVYQQLATKAASAIYGRVEALCGGSDLMTPEVISKLTAAELRAVGISERKASYLHDLAKHFISGELSHGGILDMDDEALMTALTAVRGIGVWSVHMFMIFTLHRPDILPVGDLGVRKGFQKLFKLSSLPAPSQMEDLASKWRPYRSLGAWYMWRVLSMTLPFKTE